MPKSILIVDDDPRLGTALMTRLLAEGFEATCERSGLAGLASAEANRPDMIVLDLCMPDIDGLEVCRRLKANADFADCPIMLLSANLNESIRLRANMAGIVVCLDKPYEASEVVGIIRRETERAAG